MDTPEHGSCWQVDRDSAGCWTLRLDRPGTSQNSLDSAALHELDTLIRHVGSDAEATQVLVRSAKPKGFCAGADLKELGRFTSADQVESFASYGNSVMTALAGLRPPSVTIVHGACLGGGLELALACDARIVASAATIGMPEVLLGLIPGWGGTWRLPGLIGLDRALDLLLSGRSIDGPEALQIGLVDVVVEPEELDEAIARLRKSPPSREPIPLPDDWRDRLSTARRAIPDDDMRPARETLLSVVEAELGTGTVAAPRGLARSVFEPKGRAALGSFAAKHAH